MLIFFKKIDKNKTNSKTIILANKLQTINDVHIPKNTRSVVINTFLNISSRLQGILHHSCKFYTVFTDNVKVSIL